MDQIFNSRPAEFRIARWLVIFGAGIAAITVAIAIPWKRDADAEIKSNHVVASDARTSHHAKEISTKLGALHGAALDFAAESELPQHAISDPVAVRAFVESSRFVPDKPYVIRIPKASSHTENVMLRSIRGRVGLRLSRPSPFPIIDLHHGCVSLSSANRADAWYLLKTGELSRLSNSIDRAEVARSNGIIYLRDAPWTDVFAVIDNSTDRVDTPYVLEITVGAIRSESPITWGCYQEERLKEFYYDAVYLREGYNQAGGILEQFPAFYRIDPPSFRIVHGELLSVRVLRESGEELMNYQPEDDAIDLEKQD